MNKEDVIGFILNGLYHDADNKIDLPILKIQIQATFGESINEELEKDVVDILTAEDLCKKQFEMGMITLELTGKGKNIIYTYKTYSKYLEDKDKRVKMIKNKLKEIVFEQFRKANSKAGHIIMLRNFHFGILPKLPPPESELFQDASNELIAEEYITYESGSPECFRLTEKGYQRIYDLDYQEIIVEEQKEVLPTIIVLTAVQAEYKAVRRHLNNIIDYNREGTAYESGVFAFADTDIANVIIRECGSKNNIASQEAERAINYFRPDCMFFVGIAGSRKPQDFSHGDVIFPEKIYYYEAGKAEKESFKARPEAISPTYDLFELAKQERNKDDWKIFIPKKWADKTIDANIGVIASGEQILEHYNSDLGKLLTEHYNDAAVIEMEGFGFAKAVLRQGREKNIMVGVVRGISDIIERSNNSDENSVVDRRPPNAQELASDTAAAFTFWLIYKVFNNKKIKVNETGTIRESIKVKSKIEELQEKQIRLSVKPRLSMNGGSSRGYEGELQLNITNKGERAILKTFRVREGDVEVHNEYLPWNLEKDGERKIFLRTIGRKNSNMASYKIEIEYEDALEFKYISVLEGTGAKCKLIETVEI